MKVTYEVQAELLETTLEANGVNIHIKFGQIMTQKTTGKPLKYSGFLQ